MFSDGWDDMRQILLSANIIDMRGMVGFIPPQAKYPQIGGRAGITQSQAFQSRPCFL
jgi:hypothetical protein